MDKATFEAIETRWKEPSSGNCETVLEQARADIQLLIAMLRQVHFKPVEDSLTEGEALILETLAAGKVLDDVPRIKDQHGNLVASTAEVRGLLDRGYLSYRHGYPHHLITEAGHKALDKYRAKRDAALGDIPQSEVL